MQQNTSKHCGVIAGCCLLDEEVALLPLSHADGALGLAGAVHEGGEAVETYAVVVVTLVSAYERAVGVVEADETGVSSMYPSRALLWFFGWRCASQKTTRGLQLGAVSPRGARLWF